MKKVLISIAFLIPLLWAGSTWFFSNQAEEVFAQMLTQSNQKIIQEIPFIKIEKKSFEKGFINSTAKSTVMIDPEIFGSDEPLSLSVNHTIFHGPIMLTPDGVKVGSTYIRTTLDQASLSPETRMIIKTAFNGVEPVVAGMLTGTSDKIDVDLEIAPIHFDSETFDAKTGSQNQDKMNLTLDGLSGKFVTNADATQLKGTLDLGTLKLNGKETGKDIYMVMGASIMEFDVDEIYAGTILDGTVEIRTPEFSLSDGEGHGISLQALTIRSTADELMGNFGGIGTINVKKVLVKSQDAPFQFPESSLHMSFGLKGLEREAIKKVIDSGKVMRQSQFMMLAKNNPEQSAEELAQTMSGYFNVLGNALKQGVETNNLIEISNDRGKSAIKFDLTYTDTKMLFDLKTVKEVIEALKGQLKINFDKNMISGTSAEEAIGMPLAMGFVIDKGESYESVANLEGGQLIVNGESMPILEMMGSVANQPLPWGAMSGLMQ